MTRAMTVLSTPPRTTPRDPAPVLWAVTASAWLLVVALLVTGGTSVANHDAVLENDQWSWALRTSTFLAAWLVMLTAMMLPSTVPVARIFTRLIARRAAAGRPGTGAGGGRALLPFYGAYLAVWTWFAFVALLADTGVHHAVEKWAWLGQRPGLVLGTTLVVAGAYQLSPLKDACLRGCRSPLGMVTQHYRSGAAGAWRVGTRHALSCLGCCWALMLVMFATGVGSIAWMVGLTAVMTLEKTSRFGARLVVPLGGVLVVAGGALSLAALV